MAAQLISGLLGEKFSSNEYTPMNFIESEEDYHLKMRAYLTICNHQDASPDSITDYPEDKETQQDLIRDLVSSMIYFGQVLVSITSLNSTTNKPYS